MAEDNRGGAGRPRQVRHEPAGNRLWLTRRQPCHKACSRTADFLALNRPPGESLPQPWQTRFGETRLGLCDPVREIASGFHIQENPSRHTAPPEFARKPGRQDRSDTWIVRDRIILA